MATPTITHLVFVDFENVPKVDLGLIEGRPVHVSLLIGKNQGKLEFALVENIHRLAAQVRLVKLDASGRNALDLTLSCYLGEALVGAPHGPFYIVSKDKDFDPLIGHLVARGVRVSRHDSFGDLPFLPKPKRSGTTKAPLVGKKSTVAKATAATPVKNKAVVDKYPKLLEQINSGKHRPGTKERLKHHIHTLYGQKSSPEQLDSVISRLAEDAIIKVDGEKIIYLK